MSILGSIIPLLQQNSFRCREVVRCGAQVPADNYKLENHPCQVQVDGQLSRGKDLLELLKHTVNLLPYLSCTQEERWPLTLSFPVQKCSLQKDDGFQQHPQHCDLHASIVGIKGLTRLSLFSALCGMFLDSYRLYAAFLRHLTSENPQLHSRRLLSETELFLFCLKVLLSSEQLYLSASVLSLHTRCGKKEYTLFV